MKYLIEDYIHPIMDGSDCVGQGFEADGYFVTAAHVVKDNPNCYVMIGGHKVPLCNYKFHFGRKTLDAYYIGKGDTYKDKGQMDVIMYNFGTSDSPLHFNIHTPTMGEVFSSYCVNPVFDPATNKYSNKYSIEKALVLGEEEGNYFYCKCKRFEGSSGSPLLWENQVVGIMHGGESKFLYCAFLKIDSFILQTNIGVKYDKTEVIKKLLPNGADRIMAIAILYAMNVDMGLMGIDLVEEGLYETNYYSIINRLPFDVNGLTEEEKKVLFEYCDYIIHSTL
jgi:hypothetical protein